MQLRYLGFIWISVEVHKRADLLCEEVANMTSISVAKAPCAAQHKQQVHSLTAKQAGTRRSDSRVLIRKRQSSCFAALQNAVNMELCGLRSLGYCGFQPSTLIKHNK